MIFLRFSTILVLLCIARGVAAQPASEAPSDARLRLGPITLDPRLAIRNVGVDTNVFNTADTPVRDLTATIGPEVDSWLRLGRLGWSGTTTVVWTYFRDTRSQRSIDFGQSGRIGLDLGPITPFVRASVEQARQRPNLEIDARVRREMIDLSGGLDVLLGARIRVTAEHGVRELRFDDVTLAGESLSRALDRRETTSALSGRLALTPLTTFVVAAEVREDRFGKTPERDSDTGSLTAGLELRPLALIAGRATVGARRFETRSPLVPDFTGVVADVELAYQLRDLTRFTGVVLRDVDYSFDLAQAYYVSTGMRVSVTQMLGGGFDVMAQAGRTGLDYRAVDTGAAGGRRRDRVDVVGLGLGRRFGTAVRLGLDLEYATRRSNVRARTYEGFRGGGTFSYGF